MASAQPSPSRSVAGSKPSSPSHNSCCDTSRRRSTASA
jgi:hypothetical protein